MRDECPRCGQDIEMIAPTSDDPGFSGDGEPYFVHHEYRDTIQGVTKWWSCYGSSRSIRHIEGPGW